MAEVFDPLTDEELDQLPRLGPEEGPSYSLAVRAQAEIRERRAHDAELDAIHKDVMTVFGTKEAP